MKRILTYLLSLLGSSALWGQDQVYNAGNMQLLSGATLGLFGSFQNNGTFADAGTSIGFYGSSTQTVSGSSAITFNNPIISNASGLTLQSSIAVSGTLSLNSGSVSLGSNTLTINSSAGTAISRTSGYVVSERSDNTAVIKWNIGSNTSTHTFPFGNSSGTYIPLLFTVTSGDVGNVSLATYGTGSNNLPLPVSPYNVSNLSNTSGSDNSAQTVDRFWEIDKDGSGGVVTVVFNATSSEVGSITGLTAQRWNNTNSAWDPPLATQSAAVTSVTVSGISSFSPWTLSAGSSLLPVELLNFDAGLNGNQVDLYWATAMEQNSDEFVIEKTRDTKTYAEVSRTQAAGNSMGELHYTSVDHQPYEGLSYYRLKQVDLDGSYRYSQLVAIDREAMASQQVQVYPNPAREAIFIRLRELEHETLTITIMDYTGKVCYHHTLPVSAAFQLYEITRATEWNTGIYTISVMGQTVNYTMMLSLE